MRLLTAAAAAIFALSAGVSSGQETLSLGVIGSLTGPASSQDQQASIGIRMAVEEINAAGGIEVGGQKYVWSIVEEDAQSRPDVAASAAQKLLSDENIRVIMGLISSAPGMAAVNLIKRAEVLYFGGFTSLDDVVGAPDAPYVFRTLDNDADVSEGFVPAVVAELGIKKLVFIVPNEDISHSIVNIYQPALEAAGVEVAVEYYQSGTTEFSPVLRKFQNQGYDTAFLSYPDSEAEGLVRQSLEIGGLPKQFLYRGGAMAPVVNYLDRIDGFSWQILTRDIEHSTDQAVLDWIERYKAFTGGDPVATTHWALTYYDTVFLLGQAMAEAGTTTDVPAISAALRNKTYSGVRTLTYDDNGRVHSLTDIGFFKDGKIYSKPNVPPQQ